MTESRGRSQSATRNRVSGVFIATPYPLARITGIGRFVRDLGRTLQSARIWSYVAYPAGESASEPPGEGGILLRWGTFRNAELALRTAARVIRYRSAFQVVHVQQTHLQSLLAILIACALGKPSVLTLHVRAPVAAGRFRKAAQAAIARLSIRLATRSVTVSPFVEDDARSNRFGIIENGVDTDLFRHSEEGRARIRSGLGLRDETVFVFAGRWTTSKGFDVLMRAVESEKLGDRRFKVMLLGEPAPDEPGLFERSMQRISHPSRFVCVGAVFDGLADYLSAGDVFVAPSRYEGMPLAFLEAMAVGLPVLASDIPVHRMLVERSGVGWMFPSGDSERMAIAMADIVDRGIPKQWGGQARTTVLRYHDLRGMVARYIAAYDEVLGAGQR